MNVVAIPIVESDTELQGTRHSSMTARDVGGTTDRAVDLPTRSPGPTPCMLPKASCGMFALALSCSGAT